MRLHPLPPDWKRERDGEGYLVPPGEPARTYRFSNPRPGSLDGLRIETLAGGKAVRVREFAWDPAGIAGPSSTPPVPASAPSPSRTTTRRRAF